ncbi:multimeric flavodoxin WrbA [Idiomarina loihiensis]|uniref:flavodoxin family protein n=1 Tax=Idiomarina TaxID=135575 RepID=UPI000D8C7D0D|nr:MULTISPECIES: flavodoxin family protein [Idiomarina]PWW40319.1 multimeric flavodoxin WrbA [Idiomarina loihiensis]TDP50010.1 multimeric flavodoxin WrbA [Idiomarina loihiensis]TDS24638.1 multimeric flavodoxin WrbA [Idiomarina sp. H2]
MDVFILITTERSEKMRSVAVVYHSTYNNTKAQAEAVFRGLNQEANIQARLIKVDEMNDDDWKFIGQAKGIIFGSPTYFGSLSSKFKAFMEKTGGIWAEQGWRNKLASGFTSSDCASGDKLQALQQILLFAAQHSMNWVNLGLLPGNFDQGQDEKNLNRLGGWIGAMAQRDKASGKLYPCDLTTAEFLGRRFADALKRTDFSGQLTAKSA